MCAKEMTGVDNALVFLSGLRMRRIVSLAGSKIRSATCNDISAVQSGRLEIIHDKSLNFTEACGLRHLSLLPQHRGIVPRELWTPSAPQRGNRLLVARLHLLRLVMTTTLDSCCLFEVRRGSIGYLAIEKLSPEIAREIGAPSTNGAFISRMTRDSEAYDAGLRPGDVVTAFNGKPIAEPSQFLRMVADAKIGSTATVTVLREGRRLEMRLPIVSTSTRVRR